MTGDAPQPGESPRDDGTPWSRADPASPSWHADQQDSGAAASATQTPTIDPPQPGRHNDEADAAQQAGAQDVHAALRPNTPAVMKPAEPRHAQPKPADKVAEHDHDRVDAERFNTVGGGTMYAARSRLRAPDREPTIVDLIAAVPAEQQAIPEATAPPEPDHNRPTVSLERTAVPGQPPSGLPRSGRRSRQDPARADRALQDRVRQERTAALLETSPFWKAEEERRARGEIPAETREKPPERRQRARRRAPRPRRPATGLTGLLALGLVAAFFAWVSAEPFWLAVGHGDQGTATVTRCTGSGVAQRCAGVFTAADGAYRVDDLALFGIEPGRRAAGSTAPARMVSSESRQAYVGSTGPLMHLRWALSFVLVLLCGLGIAGLTGAGRLDTAQARRGALLVCTAAPLLLLAGFLCVAY